MTATNPTAGSFLTLFPTGTTRPSASTIDFGRRQTIANGTTLTGGKISIYNAAGNTDIIIDLAGYFSAT